ncbi:MAG: hypothetical protein IH586_22295 [Anaerolineaceae bacterium]|nr:hypothetical protein [Anaerolineaceae bacterium]
MSWIKVESGERVNMDHIQVVELRKPVDALGLSQHRVMLYPPGDSDPVIGCQGSFEKCKYFMLDLDNLLNVKNIQAWEYVKCQCKCGCDAVIPEGMTICDECSYGVHKKQEIKAEAA